MMKRKLMNSLILVALVAPGLAMAADVETTEHKEGKHVIPEAAEHTITANVGLFSNYLYRGISQTGGKPAIQGGFDYARTSGFYAGVWGSNISWLSDAAVANSASLELDTYVGFKGAVGDASYDLGFLRYNYPGSYVANATKGDTNEIYGAVTYSIVTVKYSHSLGDTFGVPDSKGTNYLEINASYAISDTGITLGAHYGKQKFKGSSAEYTAFIASGTPTYNDYKLSAAKDFGGYVFGLAYSKTNAGAFYTSVTPEQKKLGKGTAVLSLTRSF